MEVNTKFEIGDVVWIIDNNKPMQLKITGINISINDNCVADIEYCLHHGDRKIPENKAFKTKEELIASL